MLLVRKKLLILKSFERNYNQVSMLLLYVLFSGLRLIFCYLGAVNSVNKNNFAPCTARYDGQFYGIYV